MHMCLDNSGDIYATDDYNHRLYKFGPSTGWRVLTIAGTGIAGYNGDNIPGNAAQVNYPTAITTDNLGNVYFSDKNNYRINTEFGDSKLQPISSKPSFAFDVYFIF